MSWQIFAIVSIFGTSLLVLLQRVLLHKDKLDPYVYAVLFQLSIGAFLLVLAFVKGYDLPPLHLLPVTLLSVSMYAIANVVHGMALKRLEAGVFTILYSTQAIWIMLVGVVVLGESLVPWQIAGILLVFLSILIISEKRHHLSFNRGILLGLATGPLYGIATASSAFIAKQSDPISWAVISFLAPAVVISIFRPHVIPKLKQTMNKQLFRKIILLGLLGCVTGGSLITAYSRGDISLVAPLQQTSIIITMILAAFILNEKSRPWHKAIAAIVCFIGAALIV